MSDTSAPAAWAARAIAGAIRRHAPTAVGTAFVAHGYVDQGTADSAVGPIGDYVLGAGIAVAAWLGRAARALDAHSGGAKRGVPMQSRCRPPEPRPRARHPSDQPAHPTAIAARRSRPAERESYSSFIKGTPPVSLADITTAEATGKTGSEKRADVIAAVAPLVVTKAAKGSFSAVAADAEQFAGLVFEEMLASVKQTPIVAIGLALLKHSLSNRRARGCPAWLARRCRKYRISLYTLAEMVQIQRNRSQITILVVSSPSISADAGGQNDNQSLAKRDDRERVCIGELWRQ